MVISAHDQIVTASGPQQAKSSASYQEASAT